MVAYKQKTENVAVGCLSLGSDLYFAAGVMAAGGATRVKDKSL